MVSKLFLVYYLFKVLLDSSDILIFAFIICLKSNVRRILEQSEIDFKNVMLVISKKSNMG